LLVKHNYNTNSSGCFHDHNGVRLKSLSEVLFELLITFQIFFSIERHPLAVVGNNKSCLEINYKSTIHNCDSLVNTVTSTNNSYNRWFTYNLVDNLHQCTSLSWLKHSNVCVGVYLNPNTNHSNTPIEVYAPKYCYIEPKRKVEGNIMTLKC